MPKKNSKPFPKEIKVNLAGYNDSEEPIIVTYKPSITLNHEQLFEYGDSNIKMNIHHHENNT